MIMHNINFCLSSIFSPYELSYTHDTGILCRDIIKRSKKETLPSQSFLYRDNHKTNLADFPFIFVFLDLK